MHRIVLIGPPASGKGTQCRRLQNLLNLPTLGTGKLLRKEVELGTQLGLEVESYLSSGAYVPDALIMELVKNWMARHSESGWLLDGFPRTLAQAEALEVDVSFQAPTLAIALEVPQHELEQRIASRRECADCGATVSVGPSNEKNCKECGGLLESRADDDLENFRRRFANYSELTQPLFDYYAANGKLLTINGSGTSDEVFAVINNHFHPSG
ncbi:MAG: nucleoside monophosphate kinase [Rubritalea sp.]|uniref:adenylate kinase family protein n=1 Tax=Rubritalea sp. TaxID=2109375 RepID=UPI0032424372